MNIEKGFPFPPNSLGSISLPAQSSCSSFSSVHSSAQPTPACHEHREGISLPPNPLGSIPLPAQSSCSSISLVHSSVQPTPACHEARAVSAHFFLLVWIAPAQPLHYFPPFHSLAHRPSRPSSSPGSASPST
jgi:hypothetical protein